MTDQSHTPNSAISQIPAKTDLQENPCVKQPKTRLDVMSQQYESKIVGEKKNIKLAICAIVSRTLRKDLRFSLMVLNQTATGKSHFVNSMLDPIRKTGDVLDFTDMSEAYLKRKFRDVNGKIIKLEQAENKDDKGRISLGRLKHLLTEGELTFGLAEKGEKGNSHTPKEFIVKGFPIIFTTVTDQNIDPETENRFLTVELDESEEQTKRITRYQLDRFSGLSDVYWNMSKIEHGYTELKKASAWIHQIVIPFADEMESLIPSNLNIRRDLPKLLALTCVIAFINYRDRDKFMIGKSEHLLTSMFGNTEEIHKAILIADVEDFMEAIDIAGNSLKKALNKINQKTELIYQMTKEIFNQKGLDNTGVTLKDLVTSLDVPESTIRFHLKVLQENGYLLTDEVSKEHRYHPQNKAFSTIKSSIVFPEEKYQKWIEQYLDLHNGTYFIARLQDEQKSSNPCVNS